MSMKCPKIGGVILARMDSRRLPGKVLVDIHGRSLLSYVAERVRRAPLASVIIATSSRAIDDPITTAAAALDIAVYRGSTEDVATRMLEAARNQRFDWFVRINADSPFFDPNLIAQGVECVVARELDFVTNLLPRTFPYGVALELVRTEIFAELIERDKRLEAREHPMMAVYGQLNTITWENIADPSAEPNGETTKVRMTIDTPEDLTAFTAFAQGRQGAWHAVTITDALASGYFAASESSCRSLRAR